MHRHKIVIASIKKMIGFIIFFFADSRFLRSFFVALGCEKWPGEMLELACPPSLKSLYPRYVLYIYNNQLLSHKS